MPDTVQDMNEQQLLRETAAGNEVAFAALFDQYWAGVYAHILSFLKNAAHAEEITQDIFLKLWENRQRLPALESFRNFLFIVTRNRIFSELRKKKELPAEPENFLLEEPQMVPDRQLDYKEFYHQVMEAIEQLPAQKKRVFKMYRMEQMSRQEIMRETGLSYGTVNQYLVEAVTFLKSRLRNNVSADFILYVTLTTILFD
ncbi:RNA polymerase sigma-70 factor [Chitinophaga pollutisoli]|uniref:RNA polymerase sigma-70 factor n=1 Tax=Chitinophaga pollutisoli TaxID=3133966 RepID=A0ABZ2YSK7_9BACT